MGGVRVVRISRPRTLGDCGGWPRSGGRRRRARTRPKSRPAGAAQHGLSSKTMALMTSNCGATRSLRITWPYSPRVVMRRQGGDLPALEAAGAGPLLACLSSQRSSRMSWIILICLRRLVQKNQRFIKIQRLSRTHNNAWRPRPTTRRSPWRLNPDCSCEPMHVS